MADEREDFETHRRRDAEEESRRREEDRREWQELAERFTEFNKDLFAEQAFVAAVVDILREVSRQQRSWAAGGPELARFFDMLKRGAKVSIGRLCDAVSERIRPPDLMDATEDQALLEVALNGLGFLLEHGADDGFAGARRSKRHSDFVAAIEHFNEERAQRREAVRKKWATQPAQIMNQRKPPDSITLDETRQRIRAKIAQKRTRTLRET